MRQTQRALPLVLILGLLLSACGGFGVGCDLIGIYSVQVAVRDAQGDPAANGATVTIRAADGYEASERGFGERLYIHVGDDGRSGPFAVEVTKPYFVSVTVSDVTAPVGYCGLVDPAQVAVTLKLEPDAPPVRQVVVWDKVDGYLGGAEAQLSAFVEADPGVSREVTWSSSDASVATITPDGYMRAACRDTFGRVRLTATSVADPTKYGVQEVEVEAATPDDPCL